MPLILKARLFKNGFSTQQNIIAILSNLFIYEAICSCDRCWRIYKVSFSFIRACESYFVLVWWIWNKNRLSFILYSFSLFFLPRKVFKVFRIYLNTHSVKYWMKFQEIVCFETLPPKSVHTPSLKQSSSTSVAWSAWKCLECGF